jgi:hypothetical protein
LIALCPPQARLQTFFSTGVRYFEENRDRALLARQPDLVLDLTLLSARRWRAGDGCTR